MIANETDKSGTFKGWAIVLVYVVVVGMLTYGLKPPLSMSHFAIGNSPEAQER